MRFIKSTLVMILTFTCLFSTVFAVQAEQTPTVQVSAAFIDMHSGPAAELPIFYVAEKGEWIKVLSRRTGYFKVVSQDGTQGWVSESDMGKTLDVNGNSVVVTPSGLEGLLNKFK